MKVYLGADHRGFSLKEEIKKWLTDNSLNYVDMGATIYDEKDDYTLFAEKVALMVKADEKLGKESRGILLCGSGVGVDVVANKFDGIRASMGKDINQIRAGRRDDDMNVLVLAADFTKIQEAKDLVNVFLDTKFENKARHSRRLNEIKKIEANN